MPGFQNEHNDMEAFSEDRLALLRQVLNDDGIDLPDAQTIPAASTQDPIPLSFEQEQLWLDLKGELSPRYNISGACHMQGVLNIACLEQSINTILARHAILRTTITLSPHGLIQQTILPYHSFSLPLEDVRPRATDDRYTFAMQSMTAMAQRPFDISSDLLLRAHLFQLDDHEYFLFYCFHHIVFDALSTENFLQELMLLYIAAVEKREASLASLPIQYTDYALWQRQEATQTVINTQLDYWVERLKDAPTSLHLPFDFPRSPVPTFHGESARALLSEDQVKQLTLLAQQTGTTLFTLLFTAFNVLLHYYSGQDDILVGAAAANRSRLEVEPLIGLFANTLALRTDLSGDPTFRELVARVRQALFHDFMHQAVPFGKVVNSIGATQSRNGNPFLQVMFYLRTKSLVLELPQVAVRWIPVETPISQCDLALEILPVGSQFETVVGYNTDIFMLTTIHRLLSHLQHLLHEIIQTPDTRLSHFSILTDAEYHDAVVRWNQTEKRYPHVSLHQLFEQQAQRVPTQLAVWSEERTLTYQELNEHANRLARHLRRLGVGAETLVGVCLQRSAEMIIALLAILKAGGAYVPIDPTYPPERQTYMMQDAHISVLITSHVLSSQIHYPETTLILPVEQYQASLLEEDVQNLPSLLHPQHLAYVMYTSGSTGQPKGTMIPHQAITNLIHWFQERYPLDTTDAVLQKTPISFDPSVCEIFWPLAVGAHLVIARSEGEKDGGYIADLIISQQITTFLAIPSFLQLLFEEKNVKRIQSLRRVFVGGEALSSTLQQRFFELFQQSGTSLCNTYGTTETTILMSFWQCQSNAQEQPLSIPLGKPLSNTHMYILDAYLRPVPTGVAGELYIGGLCVGRGYHGRPDLTGERFLPDPFASQPGARIYQTGDLFRARPDGTMEFLGRLDQQVKIRGYRIEPGEIEAVLRQSPLVQDAAVLSRKDASGNTSLVAYIATVDASPKVDIRTFLEHRFPTPVIPSPLVLLDQLPMDANGKVDRAALAALPISQEAETTDDVLLNPTQQMLSAIWVDLLQEQPTLHDSFFALGGHSLLVIQLASRVREQFDVDLPMNCFFEHPTLASQAHTIDMAQHESATHRLQPVSREKEERLPLAFGQQGLWFIHQLQPENPAYTIPYAFRLQGPLHISALQRSLQELLCRHEILRTTFYQSDGEPFQRIHPLPTTFPLPVYDVSSESETEREQQTALLMRQEIQRPFNLYLGPLIRALLVRLQPEEHLFVLTVHHIVFDGWSAGILTHELQSLYTAFMQDLPSPLTPLPVQYADYAYWQRKKQQDTYVRKLLQYWQTQLADVDETPILPINKQSMSMPLVEKSMTSTFTISPSVTQSLKLVSQQEETTFFMVLLAGLMILLQHYSGRDDIIVGTSVANRTQSETEGLIGFFLNRLLLRVNLADNPSFQEVLQQVRRVTLDAYAHQDLAFDRLIQVLNPSRSDTHSPFFQIHLEFLDASPSHLLLPELLVQPVTTDTETVKFDLSIFLFEKEQQLTAFWSYDTALFDEALMNHMISHYQMLLTMMPTHVHEHLNSLHRTIRQQRKDRVMKSQQAPIRFLKKGRQKMEN